jgi:lipopolysaccharide biosynthesis glycosyltransferase
MTNKISLIDRINLVIGYDPKESVAYHVFCQSVLENTSTPVCFLPLTQKSISGYSENHQDGSNLFTYTRFLVPYLFDYKGWAIFADGDMVCKDDISKLWELRDSSKAIQVVKHNYKTKMATKYCGSNNENYPRKNWSSLVLWNCEHPSNRILTPKFIESNTGSFLHQFKWIDDHLIGELPLEWNWLAIEYESNNLASLIHYTLGTPCFQDFKNSDMSDAWHQVFQRTIKGIGD